MPLKSVLCFIMLFLAIGCPAVAADEMRRAGMLAFNCFACHSSGVQGNSEIKSLHELSADEIRERLQAFKRGEGNPTIMDRIAKGYSDAEIDLIARYLANREWLND